MASGLHPLLYPDPSLHALDLVLHLDATIQDKLVVAFVAYDIYSE